MLKMAFQSDLGCGRIEEGWVLAVAPVAWHFFPRPTFISQGLILSNENSLFALRLLANLCELGPVGQNVPDEF